MHDPRVAIAHHHSNARRVEGSELDDSTARRRRCKAVMIAAVFILMAALLLWAAIGIRGILAERAGQRVLEGALAKLEAAGLQVDRVEPGSSKHSLRPPDHTGWQNEATDEVAWACPIIKLYGDVLKKSSVGALPAPPPPADVDPLLWTQVWSYNAFSQDVRLRLQSVSMHRPAAAPDRNVSWQNVLFVTNLALKPYETPIDPKEFEPAARETIQFLRITLESVRKRDPSLAPWSTQSGQIRSYICDLARSFMNSSWALALWAREMGEKELALELFHDSIEFGRYNAGLVRSLHNLIWVFAGFNAHVYPILNSAEGTTGLSPESISRLIDITSCVIAEMNMLGEKLWLFEVMATWDVYQKASESPEELAKLHRSTTWRIDWFGEVQRWLEHRCPPWMEREPRVPPGWLNHGIANAQHMNLILRSTGEMDRLAILELEQAWALMRAGLPGTERELKLAKDRFEVLHRQWSYFMRALTEARMGLVVLHLELYRKRTGGIPATLADLGIEPEGLIDPLDSGGGTFSYDIRPDGGYILGSIGLPDDSSPPSRNRLYWHQHP